MAEAWVAGSPLIVGLERWARSVSAPMGVNDEGLERLDPDELHYGIELFSGARLTADGSDGDNVLGVVWALAMTGEPDKCYPCVILSPRPVLEALVTTEVRDEDAQAWLDEGHEWLRESSWFCVAAELAGLSLPAVGST
jgi:hypothetical protein